MLVAAALLWAADPITPAGSMAFPRSGHAMTLLQDGSVLVTGGASLRAARSAERYVPGRNTWMGAGAMRSPHADHTATLLKDGRVLVVGGRAGRAAGAELYDPAAGTWTAAEAPATARAGHTATLLPDGRVLVVGGEDVGLQTHAAEHFATMAEVFDPLGGRWSAAGALQSGRSRHTATLLPDGRVLVLGGLGCTGILDSAEAFDPATGAWSAAAPLPVRVYGHTATLLTTGRVLVTGGLGMQDSREPEPQVLSWTAQVDPATDRWSPVEAASAGRFGHTATMLRDGKILVVGGGPPGVPAAEVYDPRRARWSGVRSGMPAGYAHTATLLADGGVLIAGGQPVTRAVSAEVYRPVR